MLIISRLYDPGYMTIKYNIISSFFSSSILISRANLSSVDTSNNRLNTHIRYIIAMSDDDIGFTGRVRQPQNRTSSRRRYLSTTVHEAMDLRRIRDHAQRLLDVLTNVENAGYLTDDQKLRVWCEGIDLLKIVFFVCLLLV